MLSNPGKLSHKGCAVLRNSDGAIEMFFLGWSYTMARNHYINEVMERVPMDRNAATDIVDQKWTFEDNIPVIGYKPLKRKKKGK